MYLAFLNLGTSEMILILLVILILFGADKAPALARSLGKARAQLDEARGQLTSAIRSAEEKALDEQFAFEKERERKIAETYESPEHAALVRAAEELGLQTQGLTDDELRAAIRAKMGGAPAGGEKGSEKAADAQQ